MSMKEKSAKLFALIFLGCILCLIPGNSRERKKPKFFELENGLKVFLYERHTLPLVNLSFGVNLGSKDESDETNGLVHILEHYMLFRGTESRNETEISQDIRRHGAYFNAYTGYDLTIFEMTLHSEYVDFALENQKDIVFNLKLTQEELDEEKQVILEEISQIQDDAMKYATSLVYQNLFKNFPYQRPIYGKKEIIEAVTVEEVENFYKKYFVPSNCALAVVGDINIEELEEKVKKIFGDSRNGQFTPAKFEKISLLEKNVEIEKEMDVNQAYLVIGFIGPDFNHPDQYAMDVLVEILGRGVNPMLNIPLRGRRNLVRSISIGYNSLKYGGAILIFLTLDPKNINAVKMELKKFLKEIKHQNYSKKDYYDEYKFYAFDYLESAKNQIKFKSHKLDQKGLNVSTSLIIFMLKNEDTERGSYIENIDRITSTDLRKIAGKYFSKGRCVIASIVPKEKK